MLNTYLMVWWYGETRYLLRSMSLLVPYDTYVKATASTGAAGRS